MRQEGFFTRFDAQLRFQGNFFSLTSKFERYQRLATVKDKISSVVRLRIRK